MIATEKLELRELLRDVIREELLKLQMSLTPYVSDKEMRDIKKSLKDEDFTDRDFEDLTEWLGQ